jgi:hypothetical protein
MLAKNRSRRCVLLAVPVLLVLAFATPAQAQSPSNPWSHLWSWLSAFGLAQDDGGQNLDEGPTIDPDGRNRVTSNADEGPTIDPNGRKG